LDFTVVIPTRNRPEYLSQAVESVFAQNAVSFEVLIIDDGVQAPIPFADSNIRVLNNSQRGPVPARNLGVSQAQGDYIAFLDDDDWWTQPDFLSRSFETLRSGHDFTFADGTLVFMDGAPDLAFAFDANAATLKKDNSILISTVCYARALHISLGMFDEALPYYWDWDWYLRVARSGVSLKRIPESMVSIRVHAGNMSSAVQETARKNNLNALTVKHGLAPLVLKNHLSLARENPINN
jgi:glycosyltransferase involved in cell wall biosynthesis